jgi:hypothetical protein
MPRLHLYILVSLSTALLVSPARGDQFEHYINPILANAIETSENVKEVKQLTSDEIFQASQTLPDSAATFLIVLTNERRYCKLLVTPARQRVGMNEQVPMLLVDKYVTYKEGSDRAIKAGGQNAHLYPGSRLHLDLGQVVPEKLGGDLLVVEGEKDALAIVVKPLGKARLFLLTKPIAGLAPKKAAKLVIGEQFEVRYFNGSYKLRDDGRRSGTLTLQVADSGDVTGSFYSDRDGQKYEVKGKVGNPRYAINFTIKFPAVEQAFAGLMFTGDGKAIAGTSKLQEREAGFYAERIDE